MRKRMISAVLALCMALTLPPVNVWAEDEPETSDTIVNNIQTLAEILTSDEDHTPTITGNTISLSAGITLSGNLVINCNAEINLNNQTINMGEHYIQVESAKKVVFKSTNGWNGKIKSSSNTAAVIAMRGCNLTVSNVDIEVEAPGAGFGVMAGPNPQNGNLKTILSLSDMKFSGGQGGVMVHGDIKDTKAGSYPVLTLNNVSVNSYYDTGRIGLYLAGMAETTIKRPQNSSVYASCEIYGTPAIQIKSGTLVIDGATIGSRGAPAADPTPNENGIVSDGSAILIENHPGYAGNINITIKGESDVSTISSNLIREITADGWNGKPPQIAVQGRKLDGPVKIEYAKMTVNKENWELLPKESQTVQPYGKNDTYQKACERLNLNLIEPTEEQPSYILSIDNLKLQSLIKQTNDKDKEYWSILADEDDALWYKAMYTVPASLKGKVTAASVQFQEYHMSEIAPFEDAALEKDGSFYYPVKVYYDGDTVEGTVTIQWLGKNDSLLAVTTAGVKAELAPPLEVSFNSDGGSSVESAQVSSGDLVPEPEEPTRENYVFDGWYPTEDHVTRWDFSKRTITKNTTLYAKWLIARTVTFDSQQGSTVSAVKVGDGRKASKPADPTRAKHRFAGWFKEAECKNPWDFDYTVNSDVTLYAKWLKVYTVAFNSQEGTAVASAEAVEGGKAKEPEAPTRTGYRFDGWYQDEKCTKKWDFNTILDARLDESMKNGTITLYAKWRKVYTVTFDLQYDGKTTAKTVDENKPAERPADPERNGYSFDNWYQEKDCESLWDFNYLIDKDVTLYAGWEKNPCVIKLDPNGGFLASGEAATVTANKDGQLTDLPADPVRSGYTFDGWYTEKEGGEPVTTSTVFEKDSTIYARWTAAPFAPSGPRSYIITFDANGGGSNITMATGKDGKLSVLPDPPVYTGCTFDGWYTAASGGEKITTSTVFQGHTTVYAHWTASSGQPSTPSDPSNPSNPSAPSGTQYLIYTPNYTSGGSFYVSHDSAAEGTRVTIRLAPWSGYQLSQLSVTNYATGRQLSLSRVSATEYAFTMPAGSVSVSITFTGGAYAPAQSQTANRTVGWYYSGGYIYHTANGLVPTASPLTRDMLISVLYNMHGASHDEPAVWAVGNGIVPDVYSSLLWGADKSITREQMAAILYCYAEYKGYNTSQRTSLTGYADYSEIRAAVQPAMCWARATGLVTGTSATTLSPQAILTCGQANTILLRFITSVVQGR